jgi:hypothetical protein
MRDLVPQHAALMMDRQQSKHHFHQTFMTFIFVNI